MNGARSLNEVANGVQNRKHFGTSFNLESVRRTLTDKNSGNILKLVTEPNKMSKLPSLWEAGGSFGVEAFTYALLDRKLHTIRPNIVNRNTKSLEMRQAQQTVWGNCHLITGAYVRKHHKAKVQMDNEVVIRLYELSHFDMELPAGKGGNAYPVNYAYFKLKHELTFETLDLFMQRTVDYSDPEVYYKSTERLSIADKMVRIIQGKLLGFFNQEPLLSKRWLPVSETIDIQPALLENSKKVDTIFEVYQEATRGCWDANANRFKNTPQYHMRLDIIPHMEYNDSEKYLEPNDENNVTVQVTMNNGSSYYTVLNLDKLTLFWFPDHDTWSEYDIKIMHDELRRKPDNTPVEPAHTTTEDPIMEALNGDDNATTVSEAKPRKVLHRITRMYRYIG